MINDAITIVQEEKYSPKFRYILVDEFQDISQNQYRLLKTLQEKSNCKIFCVGDDWQSIYSFGGADVSIMLYFGKLFKFSDRCFLTTTFRFGQQLCDFSTKFILKNSNQIPKKISSELKNTDDKPAVSIVRNEDMRGLETIIEDIAKRREGKDILILGRYKKMKPPNLIEIRKSHPNLKIEYMTIHKSKGLQRDYVIIVGLESGKFGFPSKIEDDPILDLVLTKQDTTYPNAEERRVFYVAITRAIKHVYMLITNESNISEFISEIENEEYTINMTKNSGQFVSCPNCKTGKIIKRPNSKEVYYQCSNFPLCNYKAQECSRCHKGFRYRKNYRYHCSNCDYVV